MPIWFILIYLFIYLYIYFYKKTSSDRIKKNQRKNNSGYISSRRQSAFTEAQCEHDHSNDIEFLRQAVAKTGDRQRTAQRKTQNVVPTGIALEELNRAYSKDGVNKKIKTLKQMEETLHKKHVKDGKNDATHILDRISKILFPLAFLIFNILYIIVVYMKQKKNWFW